MQIFRIFPPFSTQISKQTGKQSASATTSIFRLRMGRVRDQDHRNHISKPLKKSREITSKIAKAAADGATVL